MRPAEPVEVAPVVESTTVGAAFARRASVPMAWSVASSDVDELWRPLTVTEPRTGYEPVTALDPRAPGPMRSGGPSEWLPDLSALDF